MTERWQPTDEQSIRLSVAYHDGWDMRDTDAMFQVIADIVEQAVGEAREKWTADTIARMEVSVEVYRKQCERAEKAEAEQDWVKFLLGVSHEAKMRWEEGCKSWVSGQTQIVRDDEARLAAWYAECDAIGIPHDPSTLVKHHRANAGLASYINANTEKVLRERAEEERDESIVQHAATKARLQWLVDRVCDISVEATPIHPATKVEFPDDTVIERSR